MVSITCESQGGRVECRHLVEKGRQSSLSRIKRRNHVELCADRFNAPGAEVSFKADPDHKTGRAKIRCSVPKVSLEIADAPQVSLQLRVVPRWGRWDFTLSVRDHF